jgi:alpha-beta hydrolase superfamily lysophospholipase
MIERLEGHFWGYQDCELYYQLWKPADSIGTIVVTHGIAEHSECYNDFAQKMAEGKWQVVAWDLRGHGRSEGKRGYVNRFQDYCDDLDAFIKFCKAGIVDKTKPLVLFGHSMGGLILLKTVLNYAPQNVAALALSSPAMGISLKVPQLKIKAAHILADWMPKVTLHNEIHYEQITRDDKRNQSYKSDPLRHDKISPRLFLGMMEAMEEVHKGAGEYHWPLIMQLAGKEKIVSTPEAERLFENMASDKKQLYVYADSYHETFNDLDKEDVFRDLLNYLGKL